MSFDSGDWTDEVPFSYGEDGTEPAQDAGADTDNALPPPEPALDFPRVSISDIYTRPSPEAAFTWAGRIPRGHVTLLGAHGGTGKSMMALQLAVATCLGAPFLGAATEQGKVIFFSGEDATAVLRNRLEYVTAHHGADPESLEKWLTVLDATEQPALYREVSQFGIRTGEPTPGFARLAEIVAESRPSLIIVDNASDVFEGSENDRSAVRGFMRSLRRLFPDGSEPPAILLLAHIQKQAVGNRSAESYSGSTAWHNSARSRLALTAEQGDPSRLILSHDKLNVGPRTAAPLRLVRSYTGMLMLDDGAHDAEDATKEPPETALLRILADFVKRDEKVSTAPNSPRTNAWSLFRQETGFPKRSYPNAGALFSALRQMERAGLIEQLEYRNQSRKDKTAWTLTPKGWGEIGEVAPSATGAPTPEVETVEAVGAEVSTARSAPSAPTSGARSVRGAERTQVDAEVDANLPGSPMAEKSEPRAKRQRSKKS